MQSLDIQIQNDAIRFRDGDSYKARMHRHNDLQITIPLQHASFEIVWRVEGGHHEHKMLGAGGICIIPPRHEHQLLWVNKAHFLNLHISLKTIQAQLGKLYALDHLMLVEQIGIKDAFLQNIGNGIRQIIQSHGVKAMGYYRSSLELALHHVYANYVQKPAVVSSLAATDRLPCPKIRAVVSYMHAHCNRNVTIEELAAIAKMSAFHFMRIFKQSVGMSPARFHMLHRIERGKEMLAETAKPIGLIAKELGFCSQAYFGKIFAKHIGATPARFRQNHAR